MDFFVPQEQVCLSSYRSQGGIDLLLSLVSLFKMDLQGQEEHYLGLKSKQDR